ncbi:hypothetical protein CLV57_2207 [Mucilaginibacter auburnensis]|uniref:DUF7674 domain-containing protein n=2 Tax=Mucilaginibacter auburnensis TaxID=1457233 RepID=A0A2H9VL94_9SPHI|nr:hypothetical protein CLV57_2207 [Mucilaginibacter auburnensis]
MVPEYNYESNAFKDDGIYLFMNDFASTLAESIKQDPNSHFVSNSFNYINTIGERSDPDVINLINVGIIEILYTEQSLSRAFIAMRLSEKLSVLFHAWSEHYR